VFLAGCLFRWVDLFPELPAGLKTFESLVVDEFISRLNHIAEIKNRFAGFGRIHGLWEIC
jgi:hypothetical protein